MSLNNSKSNAQPEFSSIKKNNDPLKCACMPLTPKSDQHEISLYNISTLSSRQAMRITKIIN